MRPFFCQKYVFSGKSLPDFSKLYPRNYLKMFPTGELVFIAAENTANELATGGFAKNILVLALDEQNSAANKAFIAKVLQAATLDLAKDALFAEVAANQPVNCFAGLAERPKFIFVFGLLPAQVGLQASVQPYQTLSFHGATWLFADALGTLEPDPARKRKLWEALKPLFL
jgi:hypothetical protein